MARRNEEARFEAIIHGAKIEEKKDVGVKLNEKEVNFAKASQERMIREKQEEIAKRKQNMTQKKGIRNVK